jgi:hypothetical protein
MGFAKTIEQLGQAGPLNIVWGAGCSYAGQYAAKSLIDSLRINRRLKIDGPEGLHDALMTLDPWTRREKTGGFASNWAHLCLAELFRTGGVARVLTANFDGGLVTAVSALRLLPALYEKQFPELSVSALPSIYLVGEAPQATVTGLIERGAQTGAWLVIGCSGNHFGLADALRATPRFEHGLHWVGHFDQGPPQSLGTEFFTDSRNAHYIGGFDADSFMAYLLRGLGEFPPAFVREETGVSKEPARQLYLWCNGFRERAYRIRNQFPESARDLLQKAADARGAGYEQLVDQATRDFELYFRWVPGAGYTASVHLSILAEKRSPAEAVRLCRKGLDFIERFPAGDRMGELEACQIAKAYTHRASFRTGAEADALYRKAEQTLAAIDPGPMGAFVLEQCADLLCQWADQERNSEADAIFDRAREKFAAAQRLDPKKTERLFHYCQALHKRAAAVSGERALELSAAARRAAEEMLAGFPKAAGVWQLLGLLAFVDLQKRSGPQPDWLAEAERCFRQAISLRPDAEGDLLGSWAAGLGVSAMESSGEKAIELYTLADAKFAESEKIKPDSRALRKNWSSALLRYAREQKGPAELWERAKQQAEKAETITQGSGAYNLACIAAELGDRDAVERWLTHAAEYGQMMPLSHTLRDVNFQRFREDARFQALLRDIYDH